ncbi:MAG: hypothetical protein IKW06_00725 [Clostridia bacterium]|nr:hypothetical protein [Clostridia bacterium]
MGFLSEKAAYLRGLADGLKIDDSKDEGKVIAKMLDLLEELAITVEEVNDVVETCEERIDDLEDFAEELSDCFSDCDCGCDDDCDCGCDCDCDCDCDDDLEFYEIECPHCEEKVYFDENMIDSGNLVCPNCNASIEFEDEE